MNFAQSVIRFISGLELTVTLPSGVVVMNPFLDETTLEICKLFYNQFYADQNKRWMIIGINPGRFGGGITGIPFTDPIRLKIDAGISNPWELKQELSSVFVYDMIKAYGGTEAFYKKFYFSAISPLGFTKSNKNLNYYDDKVLQEAIKDYVIDCMNKQLDFGIQRNAAFCLGEGKNFAYLSKLNEKHSFFERIIPLSHPRFIMQYRLKRKEEFIKHYLKQFELFC